MNQLEQRMLEILKRGKEHFGYAGVKAEFEAEGTRMEEMLRLMDITRRAGLNIGLKIGGCEAVRDLIDCKQIGADYIIAPMVESPYALSKFVQIKNNRYSAFERKQVQFLFNMETHVAFASLEPILKTASMTGGVNGVVFGRVDYSGSCGLARNAINDDRITNDCVTVGKACKAHGLDFVVGGGVARESIAALRRIRETHLTRFETRKIIFSAQALDGHVEEGLIHANEFELCWLQNKREYYMGVASEDAKRIEMLETRLQELKSTAKQEKRPAVA